MCGLHFIHLTGEIMKRRFVIFALLFAGTLFVVYFIWHVRQVLYPFVLAMLIAYILHPLIDQLEKRKIARGWAILLTYAVILGGLAECLLQVIGPIARQLDQFGREVPALTMQVEHFSGILQDRYEQSALPASLRVAFDSAIATTGQRVQDFVNDIVNGCLQLFSHLIGILLAPVLSFYILLDWPHMKRKIYHFVPRRGRRRLGMLINDIDRVLNGVIRGQLVVALAVGVCVTAGLFYLHVPYAILVGIVAGLLDVIPYFGAFFGALPAVALAALTSPWLAVKVGVLFFIIHQLEGTIIGPKIMGESVGLSPVTVIFSLFVGGEFWGVAGMLFAVPFAAVLKVVWYHLFAYLV